MSALVVAARRTPFTRLDGELAAFDARRLAAIAIGDLVRDLPADVPIDDVIIANATGPGGNIARRAALDAGCDVGTPGLTIDRQCGGGLDAVILACRLVAAGAGDLYVAGGTESASTSPLRDLPAADRGRGGRDFFPRREFSGGEWEDPGMAEAAEIVAHELGITRERQDRYAAASHARAVAATRANRFAREVVRIAGADGEPIGDTCPRPTITPERLARMPAVTRTGGHVTAGNASQIADGAAVVLVASTRMAARLADHALVHLGSATVGVDPRYCVLGAVAAAHRLAERHPGFSPAAVSHVAMVEAFASQVCATVDALELDPDRVNPDGGSIGLGHPWAATGAAQVVRLMSALDPGTDGLALAAVAGGMGSAAWFERVAT